LRFYRFFEGEVPHYLSRHFWWAYMWRGLTWFFDHPVIISSILFGQYRKLKLATIEHVSRVAMKGRTLQLTCVYGRLTPSVMEHLEPAPLHITDIVPVQLELARDKAPDPGKLLATRMNAEHLAYRDNSFSTLLIFFLLHELPPDARRRTLRECMRVLAPGGTLVVTEYAESPRGHVFYRSPVARRILYRAEPFLEAFWSEDLLGLLRSLAGEIGKLVEVASHQSFFSGFYRVTEYRLTDRL
jgi:ubiquinone/menaquinone biosynthesis C-methylase UbiE